MTFGSRSFDAPSMRRVIPATVAPAADTIRVGVEAAVVIDGESNPIYAINVLPSPIVTGDRVVVDFVAGGTAFIVGLLRESGYQKPLFKGRNTSATGIGIPAQLVPASTETEAVFSDGSGAFENIPIENVGGFVAATGGLGVVVPDSRLYFIKAWGQFEADTTGYRRMDLLVNGSEVPGCSERHGVTGSASVVTQMSIATHRYLTAGDEVGVILHHSASGALDTVCYLEMKGDD